jgi:hypothetical protein
MTMRPAQRLTLFLLLAPAVLWLGLRLTGQSLGTTLKQA